MATKTNETGIEFWLQLLTTLHPEKQRKDFKFIQVKPKETVYRQGSPVTGVYFIKSGKAKVLLSATHKTQRIIHISMENDFLGYKEVICGKAEYSNTVVALEAVTLFFIPAKIFIELLSNHQKQAWAFAQLLSNDLLEFEQNMVGFNLKPITKSVGYTLLWLDNYFKEANGNPAMIPLERGELASIIGTATEALIRTLAVFKSKKLISTERTKLRILSRKGLQKIVKG